MRAVLQRVENGSITVEDRITGKIHWGLLVYLGIEKEDEESDLDYLIDKIINLRIFEDPDGKMNLSVQDTRGEILVVSQFTLCADTRKGRRPSYNGAAHPEKAEKFYRMFVERLIREDFNVGEGEFAAKMRVAYTNVGPVTILLDSKKTF